MEKKAKKELLIQRRRQLEKLSASTSTTYPALTRFYLLKKKASEEDENNNQDQVHRYGHCPYCSVQYFPGTHSTKLLPRMKLTAKIGRLLKKNAADPGSLEKFQQKLVNDYVTGRNRLAVKCLLCQKTVKIPGQSRKDRYRQKHTLETNDEKEVIQIPKTRKEKLKEKKKKLKQKKRANLDTTDHNAGLTFSIRSSTVLRDSDDQETRNQTLSERDKPLAASPSQRKETESQQNSKFSINHKNLVKDIQSLSDSKSIYDSKKKTATKSAANLIDSQKVSKLKPAAVHVKEKKRKMKNLHQQLGNILKQEKNKTGQGTLADFLSAL